VLTPELRPAGINLDALEGGHESLTRSLPAWVRRFGLLAGAGQYCLWCEPRPAPRQTFPSQIILDIPRARYLIEIFDTATRTWVSRESAEGGPLVAGLSYTGTPLLVWIRIFRS
jgi:hypothetical protein